MNTNNGTKRIEWIDALRGFTMFLVVHSHVEVLGMDIPAHISGLNSVVTLFFMPLFFFISGFFAYRANDTLNFKSYSANMLKKLRVLTIPTLFFGFLYATTLYALKNNISPSESIVVFFNHDMKLGYWFTEALLIMFIIYYTISFLLRKRKLITRQVVLVAIAFLLLKLQKYTLTNNNQMVNWFCLKHIFTYFQYFVFGIIISCYRNKAFKLLENDIIGGCIILLFAGLYILHHWEVNFFPKKIQTYTIAYLGILMTINIFRHYSNFFSSKTMIGRGLQYIGRRTLDVYLIHYFFIPTIPFLGVFFMKHNIFILQSSTAIILSLLIILFTLIVSNIIRTSPFLAYWLLGVKRDKK